MKTRIKLKKKIKIKLINKIVIISILVFLNSVFLLVTFNKNTKPLLLSYARNKIELETKTLIVETIRKEFDEKGIKYDDFFNIVNNSKDEIIFIDYDTLKINDLLNNITSNLINNLKEVEDSAFLNNNTVYYIPFGAITNLISSNWIGPQIPIKVMTSGSVETKLETDIKEYGINNVILEIYINIDVNTNILLPYTSDNINVNYKVPIIKKVIDGKIPNVYGGLYSSSSNITSNTLE